MGGAGMGGPTPIYRPLGVRIGAALGVSSSRRATLLAVVVCVLMLSVAVPLRNYAGQRAELAAVYQQQRILTDKIAELERRRNLLSDPQEVQTQARERLRYARPGEVPYAVQLPPGGLLPGEPTPQEPTQPWYNRLWKSINGG